MDSDIKAYYAEGESSYNYKIIQSEAQSFSIAQASSKNITFTFPDYSQVIAFVSYTKDTSLKYLTPYTPSISGNTITCRFSDVRASNYNDGVASYFNHTVAIIVVVSSEDFIGGPVE